MSSIARWCFRHRFVVIAAWVLVLVGLGALSQAIKSDYNNSFSLPGTGSTTAQQLLPKAILERPKQGFGVPLREWFRAGLGAEMRTILDRFCRRTDFLDRSSMKNEPSHPLAAYDAHRAMIARFMQGMNHEQGGDKQR